MPGCVDTGPDTPLAGLMDGPTILEAIELLIGLLGLAVVVALIARAVRLPDTVALVIAGLLVGGLATQVGAEPVRIPHELVLGVLLPGLVFEAAYRLELGVIRRWIAGLLILAIPGVLITAGVVAVALNVVAGVPLELAFIAGAIVSATDPAAVVATFKQLRVPRSLATMVDGESLLNDGTGLVLFAIAVAAITMPISTGGAVIAFTAAVGLSVVVGLVAGLIAAAVVRYIEDPLIELTISVVLAYGTYLLADGLGLSGVLSTVTAAIVLGNFGGRVLSPGGSDAIDIVWSFLAYLLTAIAFLLIGMAIPPARLMGSLWPIAWAIVGILVGRALIVYVVLGGISRLAPIPGLERRIPVGWSNVLFWSGLRGAVAVAMALAIPDDVPQRALLQDVTFGVVLFTLLGQATTVGRLVSRFASDPEEAPSVGHETRRSPAAE
jgi:CPA1 family monovalent cation:H+ antiporter